MSFRYYSLPTYIHINAYNYRYPPAFNQGITKNPPPVLPIYNFIPRISCTFSACLMLRSNIISSLPPGMAYARTSR